MTDQTVSLLQLVKRRDQDNVDLETVDFLALPTELQYQGWNQGLPQPNQPSVDESITLLMNAGNANTLATALQSIDTKIKEIGWAQDPLNPIGVWLRAQLTGETYPRQCFILAAKRPPKGLEITNPLAYSNVIPNYNLGLTRMPAWEDVLATQITASGISIHGGTVSYTVPGDAHARIRSMSLLSNDAVFDEAWLGVKSSRYGVYPPNFVPTWRTSDSTYTPCPDTTNSADGTTVYGTKRVCTFATVTTMDYRAVIKAATAAGNTSDQRGKYVALLRAKTTDASLVVNVRAGHGYMASTTSLNSFVFQPRLQISSANAGWRYYTLGRVRIPASDGYFDSTLNGTAIAVQAEKVSGTGNLEMDTIILIPAEHCIHISGAGFGSGGGITYTWLATTRPDKRIYAQGYSTLVLPPSFVRESPLVDSDTWSIPSGSGVIVCAASRAATDKTDTLAPEFFIYPSYNSLRGSA